MGALQKYWAAHLRDLPRTSKMPSNLSAIISTINAWLQKHTQLCHSQKCLNLNMFLVFLGVVFS